MSKELDEIREELVAVEYRLTGNRLKAEFWAGSVLSRLVRVLEQEREQAQVKEIPKDEGKKKA